LLAVAWSMIKFSLVLLLSISLKYVNLISPLFTTQKSKLCDILVAININAQNIATLFKLGRNHHSIEQISYVATIDNIWKECSCKHLATIDNIWNTVVSICCIKTELFMSHFHSRKKKHFG
jgi:hypothetical protein